jgi:hypothetical protein
MHLNSNIDVGGGLHPRRKAVVQFQSDNLPGPRTALPKAARTLRCRIRRPAQVMTLCRGARFCMELLRGRAHRVGGPLFQGVPHHQVGCRGREDEEERGGTGAARLWNRRNRVCTTLHKERVFLVGCVRAVPAVPRQSRGGSLELLVHCHRPGGHLPCRRSTTHFRKSVLGFLLLGCFVRFRRYILGFCSRVILVVAGQRFRDLLRG